MPPIFDSNFEAAGFDGWNDVQGATTSTIEQIAAASGPYRGTTGLRLTIGNSEAAYVDRTDAAALAPDGSIYLGVWLRPSSLPASNQTIIRIKDPSNNLCIFLIRATGRLDAGLWADDGTTWPVTTHFTTEGLGAWVVLRLKRSSADGVTDGGLEMFVNHESVGSDLTADTYDKFDIASLRVYLGPTGGDDVVIDFDDPILSYTYPNPPAGDSYIAKPFRRPIATPFLG